MGLWGERMIEDRCIQTEPFVFRPCWDSEITLRQLIGVTHAYTSILMIVVVSDFASTQDMPKGCRTIPQYLSKNVFGTGMGRQPMGTEHGNPTSDEVERILKYYGDCPCWNLTARPQYTDWIGVVPVLAVHVHFRDIRASYIAERNDIRRAKK